MVLTPEEIAVNAEMTALRARRANIKAKLTRFQKFISKSEYNKEELVIRLKKAETTLSDFLQIQDQLNVLSNTVDENQSEEFEECYYPTIAKAHSMLKSGESIQSFETRSTVSGTEVRLPAINLPTFSGNYEEWLHFYDTFNSLINDNESLSDIQRFHYLRTSLTGDAIHVLNSLETSAANYTIAWDLLRSRFENKRLLISNHIRAIFEQPSIQKEAHHSLRQLIDNTTKHLRALKSMGEDTDYWDRLLNYLITTKLDFSTKKEWEHHTQSTLPSFQQLIEFLTRKCNTLEAMFLSKSTAYAVSSSKTFKHQETKVHMSTQQATCVFCKCNHNINQCKQFIELSISDRNNEIKKLKLCSNCLRATHSTGQCKSKFTCKTCNRRHHTLLHIDYSQSNHEISTESMSSQTQSHHSTQTSKNCSYTFLSTAQVKIYDSQGRSHLCRALLDSGSQSNFISEELANRLQLAKEATRIQIVGINSTNENTQALHQANVKIQSRINTYSTNINCLILKQITKLPSEPLNKRLYTFPSNIRLADPEFYISSSIDLLIGAQLFYSLMCIGQIKCTNNHPQLQKTHFGWILSGNVYNLQTNSKSTSCNLITDEILHETVTKFWKLEEVSNKAYFTPDDKRCEEHFQRTHHRTSEGRYVVELPFQQSPATLGDSKVMATKRFLSVERRMSKDVLLSARYKAFMNEFLELGHMKQVSTTDDVDNFYFPHHAVLKEDSITTKLRVVFDGSAKTSTGISLNQCLMVGPTIQDNLVAIVVRFRLHRIVMSADIKQMYRQILISDKHHKYQRILWRNDISEPLTTYELQTVTYGTSSAPYLATKCLQQLSKEGNIAFPTGAHITARDFYVDDLLTGAESISEAIIIRDEVMKLCASAGFELRKWVSNRPDLLEDIATSENIPNLLLDKNSTTKTLGIQWDSNNDTFLYAPPIIINKPECITKRNILSYTAQIFDPLGLISPLVVRAKIILQTLWKLSIGWDESVPISIHTLWVKYLQDIKQLQNLKIPRRVLETSCYQLHGFCDASEEAYGACLYLQSWNGTNYSAKLLCAKSRVAPLKTTTIPRLELCGALLLARLVESIIPALHIQPTNIFYWSDSTIVLSWIKATNSQLKAFAGNRVNEIRECSDPSQWFHVSSEDNPADIVSRGKSCEDFMQNTLWWNGPSWLCKSSSHWPVQQPVSTNNLPEEKTTTLSATTITTSPDLRLFERYSKLCKLTNVLAYMKRFKQNCQSKSRITGGLNLSELNSATITLVRMVQRTAFPEELTTLPESLNKNSKLYSLDPFIDEDGIIRVGGRLRKSSIPYAQKFPIALPAKHPFTRLVIEHNHQINFHCGVQATQAAIRSTYWALGGRRTIHNCIKKCVICYKTSPKVLIPKMGDLPEYRTKPTRPFINTGVDLCGPIFIKEGSRRSKKKVKAYIAIFVCMSTKAVHIEPVSDMSTETFIAAIKRFVSRRGNILNMYSDNAKNFVGANSELTELKNIFNATQEVINSNFRQSGINWHFIPPRSPNFGGLWEAAVKSTKTLLKRTLGNASVTLEEITTILTQIEAILNSRPLMPLSEDPNDQEILTPGHFLIGDSLTAPVYPNMEDTNSNRLSRWQRIEQLRQHFWSRWSKEYLGCLQTRSKWRSNLANIEVGQLVIIKEDNLPPLKWRRGRIKEVHAGADGVIRAATVQSGDGSYKRPTTKLCPLPIY